MSVAVGKASTSSDGSVKATCWLIFFGVGIRLQEFVTIWLGADISPQSIGEVVVYFAMCKN
jgi:hypothetical protein